MMKGKNRIKSTLLALLLSLAMIISYMPAWMIAYAVDGSDTEPAIEMTDETTEDLTEPEGEAETVEPADEVTDVTSEDVDDADAGETGDAEVIEDEEVTDVVEDVVEEEVPTGLDEGLLEENDEEILEEEPEFKLRASSNGTVALAFSSDVHNGTQLNNSGESNLSAIRLRKWLTNVQPLYGNSIELMGFCGDMAAASSNTSTFWTFTQTIMGVVEDEFGMTGVYAVGNHEYMNGGYGSTSNSPEVRGKYVLNGVGQEDSAYHMYCLGSNQQDYTYQSSQVTSLTNYLNSVTDGKPIIILTHFPLHYYSSRTTNNANTVIDAVNAAAAGSDGEYGTGDDKKIIFLWGHNHTVADTNYDQIFEPGDTINYSSSSSSKKTLNFFYAAAGSMSDAEYGQSAKVLGKGLVLTINNKNQLSFAYYNADGEEVTEGGPYTEQDPVYPSSISVSPKTLEVEVGRTSKPISVSYEPDTTNQKGITWTSSDPTIATVTNGKVKGVSQGTTTITATSADGACTDTCTVTVVPRSTEQTDYIIKIGNYVLSTERSTDSANGGSSSQFPWGGSSGNTYTGLAAVDYSAATSNDETISWIIEETDGGYYIMSQDGRYLNATYTSSGSSGWGGGSSTSDLKLDDTPDVWVLDAGKDLDSWVDGSYLKSSNTDRYLCEETGTSGSHLFSVRSKDNADETSIEDAGSLGEEVLATAIAVSPKTATVEAGSTKNLKVTFTPDNTTNKKITWSSSDTKVATVSSSGVVTGVAKGSAVITATYTDNTELTDTCTVTVTKAAGSGVEPEAGKKYVILASDGYALTSEGEEVGYDNGSGDQVYHYYGLAGEKYTVGENVAPDRLLWTFTASEDGKGYYIQDQNGKYLNATYGANDEGGSTGRLKLDDTKDVWVISGATSGDVVNANILQSTNATDGAGSGKYLTHGNGDNGGDNTNIFTVRSEDNATSTTFYEYSDDGTYVEDPDDPPTPIDEDGAVYKLVDSFTAEKDYLIVSANAAGSGYALTNPGGTSDGATMGRTAVTIQSGDVDGDGANDLYIASDASDVVWKATANGSGFNITNSGDYLEGKSGNVKIYDSQQYADRSWSYTDSQLKHSGGQNTYVVYYSNNAFTSTYNSTSNKIYIYEKTEQAPGTDPVTGVTLNKSSITLTEGATETLTATVAPATAADKTVTWSTSDATVATVDQTGKVTAVKAGTATITVTTTDGGKTAECVVTVTEAGEEKSVDITPTTDNPEESVTINVGDILTINVTNSSTRSDYNYNATFNSSGIAEFVGSDTVNIGANSVGQFTVKGIAKGTVDITIQNDNTYSVRKGIIHLTVVESSTPGTDPVTGVTLNKTSTTLTEGATETLTATVAPATAADKTVTWSTSNATVATVDQTGKVTAVKEGTATITVTTTDGGFTATCEVTVEAAPPAPEATKYKLTDKLEAGKEYLIVNIAEVGSSSSRALKNPGGTSSGATPGKTTVMVLEGSIIEISDTDVVWTATTNGDGFYLTNGEDYLEVYQGNLRIFNPVKQGARYWTYSDNHLTHRGGSNPYYVAYSNGSFAYSNSAADIYLFVKQEESAHTHTMTHHDAVAATCTEPGTIEYWSCSGCGKNFSDEAGTTEVTSIEIPATGHTMTHHDKVAATCTEPGTIEYWSCSVCNKNFMNEAGTTEAESIEIPAAGHKLIPVKDVAATCEESGNTAYWICDECDKYFSDEACEHEIQEGDWIIPAIGHKWGAPKWSWTEDYSSAAASFVCENDESHTTSVPATVTSEPTPATCTAGGATVYTATIPANASPDGVAKTDTKTVEIPALGHDWEFVDFTWEGNTSAVANYKCNNNEEHTQTVAATISVVTKEATCEEAGSTVYTATVTAENSLDKTAHTDTKTVDISATGHDWNNPTYVWADDNSTCTATRVCKNDANHVETETVEATYTVEEDATAETDGSATYTAEFENEAFATQTKPVVIPALGHVFDFVDITWTKIEDGYAAQANFQCRYEEDHKVPVVANVTSEVTKEATCEEDGEIVYTATVVAANSLDKAAHSATKTDTIPKKGHVWNAPTYEWAADNSTCTATRTCKNDASHPETETVTATVETTAATCVADGKKVYTATFENSAFDPQTVEVTIPKTGHTLSFTPAKEMTCTEDGNTAYYTCANCGKFFSDAEGENEIAEGSWVIASTGHDWDEVEYGWTDDNSEVIALRKCKNDSSHIETETAKTTSEETPATCEAAGKIVYTATFENSTFKTQTKSVKTSDKLGHKWGEWNVTKEPTASAEGEQVRECSVCHKTETQAIPKKGSDPTQTGTDGTAVGPGASEAAAEKAITGMKSDTDPKGASFGKLTMNSPKQTNTSITLKWTKVTGAKKYVIYGNRCGKTTKPVKLYEVKAPTLTKKVTKVNKKALKKATYHKFIVVALDKNNNVITTSKLIHVATKGGKVGNHKSVTVPKKVLTQAKALKKGKTLKIGAKAVAQSTKLTVKKHVGLRYETSNKKIATVSSKGVIKGVKKGTCYVYVYAQSGVFKKIKVVVK